MVINFDWSIFTKFNLVWIADSLLTDPLYFNNILLPSECTEWTSIVQIQSIGIYSRQWVSIDLILEILL